MLTHLDLFSGIGGFALAAQRCGFTTVGFCEIEPYAQEILKERFGAVMADSDEARRGRWTSRYGNSDAGGKAVRFASDSKTAKLHSDIFALSGHDYAGITLITGGFPCQPFSCAGKRRGKDDDRHLWPEMLRVIKESRPAWVLGENVAGIITMELDGCISDLESEGYAVQTFVIPACAVDAKHRRDRVWIVANSRQESRRQGWDIEAWSTGERCSEANQPERPSETLAHQSVEGLERTTGEVVQRGIGGLAGGSAVADADLQGPQGWNSGELQECSRERPFGSGGSFCEWRPEQDWFAESGMGRVAYGIPKRIHRLKALGNAIVPQVAEEIIRCIAVIESESDKKV